MRWVWPAVRAEQRWGEWKHTEQDGRIVKQLTRIYFICLCLFLGLFFFENLCLVLDFKCTVPHVASFIMAFIAYQVCLFHLYKRLT